LNIVFRYWVAFKRGFKKKVRKFVMRRKKLKGFGWQRWSRGWFYDKLGLYGDYRIRYYLPESAASR
jgi:RNA-directed DNA polymerase